MKDQMSLFDLDSQCGKTYPEHSAATKARTSERSSKKSAVSKTKPLLFLNLQKESGLLSEPLWETVTVLPGECWTLNSGECPNAAVESSLSQILEDNPYQKYFLSAKACQGILRRAETRGKELPPMLKEALERQVTVSAML